MKQLNAEEFFEKIYPEVVGKFGQIIFEFNAIKVTINTKDSIGNMFQDWIKAWAEQNSIYTRPNSSTQEFPDFYLSDSDEDNLLEIKSFNFESSPSFDIANFEAYFRSLLIHPKRLDTDYLVIGYSLNDGVLKIEEVWLKKIWELTRNSKKWALSMQVSHDVVKNIRPINLVPKQASDFRSFTNKLEFLEAIQNVLNQYEKTKDSHSNWLHDFKTLYNEATGISL